ncbi:breast cancer type 2 susceptibility protein-like isoform X4 [Octopus sinensis]|uniref:Breast cancer type 2 susceptibility protein-like isoform X4 n=1 Tax=Octopus sinensis TaxID=2607531 RepID=A0A7E6EYK7_9MOLL|nr:breast cancer type 2 susceptibility protein-like isoform X4 [Octopus sinensis]
MSSCGCICEPQIYAVKNLKPDAIHLKRQKVLNKLKNLSEPTSNWFIKLSLQRLLEKNALSNNATIFNNEASDLLTLTGSPVQASTPYCGNKKKSHKQNIFEEHSILSENDSSHCSSSLSLHSKSFNQPEDKFFSTSTTNNKNSLGISLDDTTYSWTSSLATPPGYIKTSSEDECKDDDNTGQITQSKFFARALFSPNGETSELEDSAILSSTIHTELNENDKTFTTTDISEYSMEVSSPVLFEAVNKDDSKSYATANFDVSEKASMSTPPADCINKDNSLLHSILIKNKQQTSTHKSVHFSDIPSSIPQKNQSKWDLVSVNPLLCQSTDIHSFNQVSDGRTPDHNSLVANVDHSPSVTGLVSDENKFEFNEEVVNCCKSSDFNSSFESAACEKNSLRALEDPVKICEASTTVVNLDIDKNHVPHSIELHVEKPQSKQHDSSIQNNLEIVKDCVNDIHSQEKHVEKFDSVTNLSEIKLVDDVSERSSESKNINCHSVCNYVESKQHKDLLVSCDSNVTVKPKSTASLSLSRKSRLKGKTKRFSYPTASQIHQSSPLVKFSFKMQNFSTSNATENHCSDSNTKLNNTTLPNFNQPFTKIESDLAKPVDDKNNIAEDSAFSTNNTVKSDIVQSNNMEEYSAVQSNKTVEDCIMNTDNSVGGCVFQTKNTAGSNTVQLKNTMENCAVQPNISVEDCVVQTKNAAEGCTADQTYNPMVGFVAVSVNNIVEGCATVETKNFLEDSAAIQTSTSLERCVVETKNSVESCAGVQTNNPEESCAAETNNTMKVSDDPQEGKKDSTISQIKELSAFPDLSKNKNIPIYLDDNLPASDNVKNKQQIASVTCDKQKPMQQTTADKIQKTVPILPRYNSLQSSKNKSSLLQKQAGFSSGIATKKSSEGNQCENVSETTNVRPSHSKQLKDFHKFSGSVEDHFTASQIVYWQSSEDFSESFNDTTIPFQHIPEISYHCYNDKLNTKLSKDIIQVDSNKQPGQREVILEKVEQNDQDIKGQKIQINEESLQKAQNLVKEKGFSTGNGQKIQLNQKSLEKAQNLVYGNDETVEKLQGFSTAGGQKIQIDEKTLQKAQNLLNDSDETVEKFQGFSIARGQKIQIDEKSLQNAQNLLNDNDETVEKFQGFSTAKGQKIQINQKSLQKAHNLLIENDETVEKFQGFSTAKGKKIEVNQKSLEKEQNVLINSEETVEKLQGFSTAKGKKIEVNQKSLEKAQNVLINSEETVEKLQGFSTARGQKIRINQKSLQKVQNLVNENDGTDGEFQGFSTAKGQKIQLNHKSLEKAQHLVYDNDETVEKLQGFSTAKGQKIQINEKSIKKAQNLLNENDETVEKFHGFSTARGQKIQINEKSLQKAQDLVDVSDETVEEFQGFSTAKMQTVQINEQNFKKVERYITDNAQYLKSDLFSEALNSTKNSDLESIELVRDMQNMKKKKFEESRSLKRKLSIKSCSDKQLPKRFCPFKSPRIINKPALLQNKFSNNTIKNVELNDKDCHVLCEEKKPSTNSLLKNQSTCSENMIEKAASGKYELKSTIPLINLTEKHLGNKTKEQNISNERQLGDNLIEIKDYVTVAEAIDDGKIDGDGHLRVSTTITNEQLEENIQNSPSDGFKIIGDEKDTKTQALLAGENEFVGPGTTGLQAHEFSSSNMTVSSTSASDRKLCNKDRPQLLVNSHSNLKTENILNEKSVIEIKQSLEKNVVNDLLFTDLNSSEVRTDTMASVSNTLSDLVKEKSVISSNEEISEQCDQLLDELQKSFSEDTTFDPPETSDSKKRNFSEISDENSTSVCKRSKCSSENSKSVSIHNEKEENCESIISKNSEISDDILAQSMEIYENQPLRSAFPIHEIKLHNTNKQMQHVDDIPVENQMNDDISDELAMTSAVEKMEKEFYFIKNNTRQAVPEKDHISKQKEIEKSISTCHDNTAGCFVAFQTALGKNVTVSEKSVKCAKQIFSENCNEENNKTGHFVAFQTALGKNVSVSENSIKCAKQILSKSNDEENSASKVLKHEMLHSHISSVKPNQSEIERNFTDAYEKNEIDPPYPSIFENLQQEDQKLLKLNSKTNSAIWKPSVSHETEDRQRILPVVTDPIQFHDFSSDKKDCNFQSLLSPNIFQGTTSHSVKSTAIIAQNTKISDFRTPYRKTGISLPDSKRHIKARSILDNKDKESMNKPIFKGCQPSACTSCSRESICSNNSSNFKSLPTDMSTTLSSDKSDASDIEYSEVSGDTAADKVTLPYIKSSKSFSCQDLSSNTTGKKKPENVIPCNINEITRKRLASKSFEGTEMRKTNPASLYHEKQNPNYPQNSLENSETGLSKPCHQKNKSKELPIKDHKIHWNINSGDINPEKNDPSLLSSTVASNVENKNSEFSKSENLISFQKARCEQDAIIIKKKQKNIQPNIGLLMSQKQSERQHKIVDFLKDTSFVQYSHQQLFAFGVRQSVLNINSTNAENYHFQLSDFYDISYFDKFVIGDGALLVPNDSGSAGKKEFFRSFLTIESVDPNLISRAWFFNHYRWVIWKLAAYEVTLPTLFGGRCLSPEMVALQLKYRYDLEIDNCKRSALRKITERDDTPAKRMILCVSNVNKDLMKADMSSKIQNTEQCIEVTDGWYPLKMILDNQLMNLVANKKIRVGQKLCICKAELVGSEEAFNPLEAYSQVQLKVNGNCCRPAKWNSRLGYQRDPRPFAIPISHIKQNGGLIGSVDVVIARIYPIMYMEKVSGSRAVFRSSHNERKAEEQYKRIQQETLERVYNKVQQNYKEIVSKGNNVKPKQFTHKDIAILDSGRDIYDAILSALHPESVQEYLTEHQRTLLANYQQEVQNLRNQKIQDELQKALSDENEKNPKRNVVAVLKARLVGCSEQDREPLATTLLTIWKPTEELINILSEGSRYRIYNLIPAQARFQSLKTTSVHLSVTRSSHFDCLKIDASKLSEIYSPRKVFTTTNIITDPCLRNYYEVDMAGIVLNISKSLTTNQHKLEQLHAVDVEGNIFTICFWGYMQVFSVDNILQEGVVFAAKNLLKYRQDGPHSVTVDASTEISDFTLNPQSGHMKECVSQLKDLKVKEGFLSAAYKRLEQRKLSLNLQGTEQKYHVKENVLHTSSSDDSTKAQKAAQQMKMSKLLVYGAASSLPPLASCSSPSVYKAFKAPTLTKAKK